MRQSHHPFQKQLTRNIPYRVIKHWYNMSVTLMFTGAVKQLLLRYSCLQGSGQATVKRHLDSKHPHLQPVVAIAAFIIHRGRIRHKLRYSTFEIVVGCVENPADGKNGTKIKCAPQHDNWCCSQQGRIQIRKGAR
jgi:hypothetical protein